MTVRNVQWILLFGGLWVGSGCAMSGKPHPASTYAPYEFRRTSTTDTIDHDALTTSNDVSTPGWMPVAALPSTLMEMSTGSVVAANDSNNAPEPTASAPRLRPGLQIGISVLVAGEKEVDEPAKRISAAGTITLPLIGLVDCSGLTLEELTKKLTARYAEFLQDPSVDVDFVIGDGPEAISPWGQVTVLGRVKQPGRINIPPTREMSLSKAIQLAGGLDTSARISNIRITRRNDAGQARQLDVNFLSIGQQGSLEKDLPLLDGDVIFVPESVF